MRSIFQTPDRRLGAVLFAAALVVGACSYGGAGASTAGGAAAASAAAPSAATSAAAPSTAASAAASGGGKYAGGGGDSYSYGSKPPAAEASAPAGGGSEVKVASGSVGSFLTGEGGKTLYIFKKDSPNTSACSGDCATNWPPFVVAAGATVTAGSGVMGKLTTFKRDDGSSQVAYNGAPLYYFVGDQAAGDTTGQNVEDFVVAAP